MEKFELIRELYERIEDDKNSNRGFSDCRYPVRFIFLNSFEELKDVVNHLSSFDTEMVDLGDILSNENSWFTPTQLINIVKNLSKNAIVFPISEYLRFMDTDDFYTTIKSLTEIEKTNLNIRIYIPLVGLEERFEKEFWNNFFRKEEWAPIWKLESFSKKICIFQINFDLPDKDIPLDNFYRISNSKEWFNLWKNDDLISIISFSKSLNYFYKNCLPDQTFELEVINNQKEYLEKILNINIPIEFNENDKNNWNNLIKDVFKFNKKGITIKEIVLKIFNIGKIENLTTRDFVNYFFNTNNQYHHWLLKIFILSLDKYKSTYLYKCFENLKTLDNENFAETLWMEIFNLSENVKDHDIFYERKILIKFLFNNYQISPNENKLKNKLDNIKLYQFKTQLKYLTNITLTEKRFIFEIIKNIDIKEYLSELIAVYPELYYYLDWNLIKPEMGIDDNIIDYFEHYNFSKVIHTKSKKIEDFINNQNKDKSTFSKWFFSIPKQKIEKNSNCIWVDGIGAEWFPLIIHLINKYGKEKGKIVTKKIITRVNLPTITQCNKNNFEKIEDFDNYVHKQKAYNYPNTLIQEIEIVKKIVKTIANEYYEKVFIISDHGFSYLCLKDFGNYKRLNFSNAKHEGRYMWIDEEKYSDDDYYITWNTDDGDCKDKKSIVALKHVSLNNTPPREVHGGATPEEILVPYILIETDKDKIQYEVEPLEFNVSISNPKIEFKISPLPLNIPEIFIDDKLLILTYDRKNNNYMLNLTGLKVGKHSILLKIGINLFNLKLDIKGGFKESDLI